MTLNIIKKIKFEASYNKNPLQVIFVDPHFIWMYK